MIPERLPFRVRGFTAELDGKILGLGGLAFLSTETTGIYLLLFDGYEKFPITLHKAALKVLNMAREMGIKKLVSLADQDFPNAERWHERLGFIPTMIYGQKVYQWTQ